MHRRKQERHLYRDAVAPTSAPFRGASTSNAKIPPGDDAGDDNKGDSYITDDDFLHDFRNYTPVVGHPGSASIDHVTTSRRSENTLAAERLGRISTTTRRELLENGALPGEASNGRGSTR